MDVVNELRECKSLLTSFRSAGAGCGERNIVPTLMPTEKSRARTNVVMNQFICAWSHAEIIRGKSNAAWISFVFGASTNQS